MSAQPFYRTDARRVQFVTEARLWLGTPFAENCAVRGRQGGVDCVHLVQAVHRACGAIPELWLPRQPVERVRHYGEHHAKSLILDWFGRSEHSGLVRRLDEGEATAIGDVAVLKIFQTEHHLALWCGSELIHVALQGGVMKHSTHDPKLPEIHRCTYRVMEVAP